MRARRERETRWERSRGRRWYRTLYARHVEISPTYHFPEVCNREKGEWQGRAELSKFGFIRRAARLRLRRWLGGGGVETAKREKERETETGDDEGRQMMPLEYLYFTRCGWKNIRRCICVATAGRREVSFTLCTLLFAASVCAPPTLLPASSLFCSLLLSAFFYVFCTPSSSLLYLAISFV